LLHNVVKTGAVIDLVNVLGQWVNSRTIELLIDLVNIKK